MLPNLERDKFFFALLECGDLKVTKEGLVYYLGILKEPQPCGDYLVIRISRKYIVLHRLVWLAFNGLIPPRLVINHLNFDKYDNQIKNLELTTYKGNNQHALKSGKYTPATVKNLGEENGLSKFTDEQVLYYRKKYLDGYLRWWDFTLETGTNDHIIKRMLLGKSYSHLGSRVEKLIRKNLE